MHTFPEIDFRAALNDDQYAAVTAGNGPALVLAGAGSGKTRTLTYRVAYLLSQGVRPWEILLLTFTNKAAREMLTRVEDITGVPRTDFWGGTFHSIGNRFLRRYAELVERTPSFTILDADDAESLFKHVAEELDPVFLKQKGAPKPPLIHGALSYARNTLRPPDDVFKERFNWLKPNERGKLVAFAEAYRLAKRDRNVCDYDDLLELWLRALDENPAIREQQQRRFKHILVDEFQDTNLLQSRIVDALAGSHQLMVVGDDAQCIYTWRGAEFANIADFPKRHPNAQIHKIEINYRSTPEILEFANGILAGQADGNGFSKILRPVRETGQRPWVVPAIDNYAQAKNVVRLVQARLEDGRDLRDITVLYRAHYQAMELQMELTRAGIPFTITSGQRFFDQAHVRDLVAHLRFVNNPADTVAFLRLMALLPKVGPRTAAKILDFAHKRALKTGAQILDVLADEIVLEKVPDAAREGFTSLVQTLRDMRDAAFGPGGKNPRNADAAGEDDVSATLQLEFADGRSDATGDAAGTAGTAPRRLRMTVKLWLRIRKLLALAKDPAASPHEATVAYERAENFARQTKHSLDLIEENETPQQAGLQLDESGNTIDDEDDEIGLDDGAASADAALKTPEDVTRLAIEGWYGDHIKVIYENWQERLDDLNNLRNFATKYTDLDEYLSQLALLTNEDAAGGRSNNSEPDTLRLTTVHQAKGLEFPVVIVIGCAEELFPIKRAIERGDVEEERRLFYVAATRAMEELYMFYPRIVRGSGPPRVLEKSQFISGLPGHTYQIVHAH